MYAMHWLLPFSQQRRKVVNLKQRAAVDNKNVHVLDHGTDFLFLFNVCSRSVQIPFVSVSHSVPFSAGELLPNKTIAECGALWRQK